MDTLRKVFGKKREHEEEPSARNQPPQATGGRARLAEAPQVHGATASYQQHGAPALASPPRLHNDGDNYERLSEANRPYAVVASLGDNPPPALVMDALLMVWFDYQFPEEGTPLCRFAVALKAMYDEIAALGFEGEARRAVLDEVHGGLRSLLEVKLPADCRASYRQAVQQSARHKESSEASEMMIHELKQMKSSLGNAPTTWNVTITTSTTTTTSTATTSTATTATVSGNALIPNFPVLEQLQSAETGSKAIACLARYEAMAMNPRAQICSASQAHIELNQAFFGEDKWKAVARTRVYSDLPEKTALRIAAERDCRHRNSAVTCDEQTNESLLGCTGNAHASIPEAHQPGNEVSIALHAPLLVAPGTVVKPVILQFPASGRRNELLARQHPELLLTAHRTTLQALSRHILQCVHDNPGKSVVLTAYGGIDSLKGLNDDQRKGLQKATAEEFAGLVKALHAKGVAVSYAEASAHSGFWNEVQLALGNVKVPMTSVGKLPNASLDGKIVVVTGSSTTLVGSGWEDRIKSAGAAIGEHSLVQTIHAGFCAAINAGMSYEAVQRIGQG